MSVKYHDSVGSRDDSPPCKVYAQIAFLSSAGRSSRADLVEEEEVIVAVELFLVDMSAEFK
jgi:hypothetical protein